MSIIISFNYVNYSDKKRLLAQKESLKTLVKLSSSIIPVAIGFKNEDTSDSEPILNDLGIQSLNILRRDSKDEIFNNRSLPYIKEIFDCCSKIDCDIFGYVNSDVLISPEIIDILNNDKDVYMFSRYEIVEMSSEDFLNSFNGENKIKKVWGGDKHLGRDAFFFKRDWWINNREMFPSDIIVGEMEWDTIYRFMIMYGNKFFNNVPSYIDKRILYHPLHRSLWDNKSNGAINNIEIWKKIKEIIGEIK